MSLRRKYSNFLMEQKCLLKSKYPFLSDEQLKTRVAQQWSKLSKDERIRFERAPNNPARKSTTARFFKSPKRDHKLLKCSNNPQEDKLDKLVKNAPASCTCDFAFDSEAGSTVEAVDSPILCLSTSKCLKTYANIKDNYFPIERFKIPRIVQDNITEQPGILKMDSNKKKRRQSHVSFGDEIKTCFSHELHADNNNKSVTKPESASQSRTTDRALKAVGAESGSNMVTRNKRPCYFPKLSNFNRKSLALKDANDDADPTVYNFNAFSSDDDNDDGVLIHYSSECHDDEVSIHGNQYLAVTSTPKSVALYSNEETIRNRSIKKSILFQIPSTNEDECNEVCSRKSDANMLTTLKATIMKSKESIFAPESEYSANLNNEELAELLDVVETDGGRKPKHNSGKCEGINIPQKRITRSQSKILPKTSDTLQEAVPEKNQCSKQSTLVAKSIKEMNADVSTKSTQEELYSITQTAENGLGMEKKNSDYCVSEDSACVVNVAISVEKDVEVEMSATAAKQHSKNKRQCGKGWRNGKCCKRRNTKVVDSDTKVEYKEHKETDNTEPRETPVPKECHNIPECYSTQNEKQLLKSSEVTGRCGKGTMQVDKVNSSNTASVNAFGNTQTELHMGKNIWRKKNLEEWDKIGFATPEGPKQRRTCKTLHKEVNKPSTVSDAAEDEQHTHITVEADVHHNASWLSFDCDDKTNNSSLIDKSFYMKNDDGSGGKQIQTMMGADASSENCIGVYDLTENNTLVNSSVQSMDTSLVLPPKSTIQQAKKDTDVFATGADCNHVSNEKNSIGEHPDYFNDDKLFVQKSPDTYGVIVDLFGNSNDTKSSTKRRLIGTKKACETGEIFSQMVEDKDIFM